jgi:hypothetical protein
MIIKIWGLWKLMIVTSKSKIKLKSWWVRISCRSKNFFWTQDGKKKDKKLV